MKKETVKKILHVIMDVLSLIFFGISSIFLFKNKNEKSEVKAENKAEKKKEETKDEIKNTAAADIVAGSTNQQDISSTIGEIKSDYRERIRDRLNSNVHR